MFSKLKNIDYKLFLSWMPWEYLVEGRANAQEWTVFVYSKRNIWFNEPL